MCVCLCVCARTHVCVSVCTCVVLVYILHLLIVYTRFPWVLDASLSLLMYQRPIFIQIKHSFPTLESARVLNTKKS